MAGARAVCRKLNLNVVLAPLMLAVALLPGTGCVPDDSTANNNRGRRTPDRAQVTVPQPGAAEVDGVRANAVDDSAFLSGAFQMLSAATTNGDYTKARTVLAGIAERAPEGTALNRVVAGWSEYIDTEEAAARMLQEAQSLRGRDADMTDLQNRVTRIKGLFDDHRLRKISRVCNDPSQLPELESYIERERPARLLWANYQGARTDMTRAITLVRLLRDTNGSELEGEARDNLTTIMEAAMRSVTDLSDTNRTREALNEARRWASIVDGLEPWASEFSEVATSLEDTANNTVRDPFSGSGDDNPLAKARGAMQELLNQRHTQLEDDPDLRYYVSQLIQRVRGLQVRVPPMPLTRHLKAVCDGLFAAGRYAELDRLLERQYESARSVSKGEADSTAALRDHYRTRFCNGVRGGGLDATAGDWCYWQLQQGYFGGREDKPMLELRVPQGATSCVLPDGNYKDFDVTFEFEIKRMTQLEFFAKADPAGRYGMSVSLQPRRGTLPVADISEADTVFARATVFLAAAQQTIAHDLAIALRNGKITVSMEANGEQATVKVNGKAVLDERLRGNTYFPERTGVIGFTLTGGDARVEFKTIRVRTKDPVNADSPTGFEERVTRREPTADELELEAAIRSARNELVEALKLARDSVLAKGQEDNAKSIDRDAQLFSAMRLHSGTADAPTFLAECMTEEGRLADADLVLEANGVATSDPQRAALADRMKPFNLEPFQGWRIVPASGGSSDDITIGKDDIRLRCGALISPQEPQLADYELTGRMKLATGSAASLLLRQTGPSTQINSFIFLRFLVTTRGEGRNAQRLIEAVEFNRGAGGVLRMPLPAPQDCSRTIAFRVVVVGASASLYLDREKVAESPQTSGLWRWSAIGFQADADGNGKADVRFTDLQIKPLRMRPPTAKD